MEKIRIEDFFDWVVSTAAIGYGGVAFTSEGIRKIKESPLEVISIDVIFETLVFTFNHHLIKSIILKETNSKVYFTVEFVSKNKNNEKTATWWTNDSNLIYVFWHFLEKPLRYPLKMINDCLENS